jgi:hypothetical protein
MTIGFNKYQFYGKIAILIIMACCGLLIYKSPGINFEDAPTGGLIFLAVICATIFYMLILMTLQLVVLPNSVKINAPGGCITLKFLFAKSLIIHANDVSRFSTIKMSTKSTEYEGMLVTMTNGKEYVLSDLNLANIKPVRRWLENNSVTFAGHYKFSFLSYFIRYFKN